MKVKCYTRNGTKIGIAKSIGIMVAVFISWSSNTYAGDGTKEVMIISCNMEDNMHSANDNDLKPSEVNGQDWVDVVTEFAYKTLEWGADIVCYVEYVRKDKVYDEVEDQSFHKTLKQIYEGAGYEMYSSETSANAGCIFSRWPILNSDYEKLYESGSGGGSKLIQWVEIDVPKVEKPLHVFNYRADHGHQQTTALGNINAGAYIKEKIGEDDDLISANPSGKRNVVITGDMNINDEMTDDPDETDITRYVEDYIGLQGHWYDSMSQKMHIISNREFNLGKMHSHAHSGYFTHYFPATDGSVEVWEWYELLTFNPSNIVVRHYDNGRTDQVRDHLIKTRIWPKGDIGVYEYENGLYDPSYAGFTAHQTPWAIISLPKE